MSGKTGGLVCNNQKRNSSSFSFMFSENPITVGNDAFIDSLLTITKKIKKDEIPVHLS